MNRVLAIAFAVATLAPLAACGTYPAEGNPWYSQGDATYDSIRHATDACESKGGKFELKPNGDPTHMGDYECARPPKGSH